MIVKLCGMRNEADLRAAIPSGATAFGFLVGRRHASPDFIAPELAASLAALLPPFATPVLVTHLAEPEAIAELVEATGIKCVQAHGGSTPAQLARLRALLPRELKIVQAIHIVDGAASQDFRAFAGLADALLLDSFDKASGRVGGTGATHDWNVSAAIVKASPVPVILAGGLGPDNVAEAIAKVRPFGVDANSRMKNASGARDAGLCASFVKRAFDAFLSL
jgi:phosphoribosylanthranilate isomerase